MKTKLSHQEQIASISERVNIISSSEVEIDDQRYPFYQQLPYNVFFDEFKNFGENCGQNKQSNQANFVQFLATVLYARFYCGIDEINQSIMLPPKQERDQFMQKLSEANTTTNGYDYLWQISAIDPTRNIFVVKNGETRQLQPNTYIPANVGSTQPNVNSFVHIMRHKEQKELQPVFYYVFGNMLQSQQIEMVRIYFNLIPEGAAQLVNEITRLFNDYKVPFSFKCLNHPDLYKRNDSAVLYLDKSHVDISILLLKEVIESIKPYLKDETPWFTHQLYKGIAYAEDPGNGQSFGMNRCTLLANALWQAHESQITDVDIKFNFIYKYLQFNGLQTTFPYLNRHTSKVPSFPQF